MAVIIILHLLVVFLSLFCATEAVSGAPGHVILEGNRGAGTYTLSFGDPKIAFQDWKAKFVHIHGHKWDDDFRFGVFSENVAKIEQHNSLYHTHKSSFYMGLNQFSAMTHDEYQRYNHLGKYSTKRQPSTRKEPSYKTVKLQFNKKVAVIPDKVNWTKEGYVTQVKDQGQCFSCWIFSATGALEGAYFSSHKELKSFSEQQILDCCQLEGCAHSCSQGGYSVAALTYVQKVHGIETEEDYPYDYKINNCRFNESKQIGLVASVMEVIPAGSEAALKSACAQHGPISVGIDASLYSFQHYYGGVYADPQCSSDPLRQDHAVLVTGYDTKDNQDYWIIKNSWSTDWGQEGYGYVARNKNNLCGIADKAVFPIIN